MNLTVITDLPYMNNEIYKRLNINTVWDKIKRNVYTGTSSVLTPLLYYIYSQIYN